LDGEFKARESRKEEQVSKAQVLEERSPEEQKTPLLE
jgi:hypothetical protein